MTTFRAYTHRRPTCHTLRRLATVVLCGITVAGCTPLDFATPAPVTPPPVSPATYQQTLRTVESTLTAALSGIESSPPLEPLAAQVDSAATETSRALSQLTTVVPPEQYVAAHARFVSAANQLASQFSVLSTQIRSQDICAAPSAMATLSTLPATEALRQAATGLGPAGIELSAALPLAETLPEHHERNGTILRDPGSGAGHLKLENQAENDVALTLARNGATVGSIYIARGETAELNNIPDGTYDIFYTSGIDWDGNEFTRSCAFRRVDTTAVFETTRTQYTVFTLKLHIPSGGNVGDVAVSPTSFPK